MSTKQEEKPNKGADKQDAKKGKGPAADLLAVEELNEED
jgi:hypothetical protein